MKNFSFLFFLLLFLDSFPQNLNRNLLVYWNFDDANAGSTHSSYVAQLHGKGTFAQGKRGLGLALNSKNSYYEILHSLSFAGNFSIAFWFKPKRVHGRQTLFRQTQLRGRAEETFVEIGIENGTICVQNAQKKVEHLPNALVANAWHLLVCNFRNGKLYLNMLVGKLSGQSVYPLKLNYSGENAVLYFGLSKLQLPDYEGIIDEVMVFKKPLSFFDIQALQHDKLPKKKLVPHAVISENTSRKEQKKTVRTASNKKNNLPERFQKKQFRSMDVLKYKHHKIEVQESATVKSTDITLEFWDWDQHDYDTIAIALNDSLILNNHLLMPKSKSDVLEFQIRPNRENLIVFYALNLGFVGANTSKIRLSAGNKHIGTYELRADEGISAAFKITHRAKNEPFTQIQKHLEVDSADIILEVWDHQIADGDFITIDFNDETILDYYELKKTRKRIPLHLGEGQNQLTFHADDMGRIGVNSVRVRIYVGETVVDEFTLLATYKKNAGLLITRTKR